MRHAFDDREGVVDTGADASDGCEIAIDGGAFAGSSRECAIHHVERSVARGEISNGACGRGDSQKKVTGRGGRMPFDGGQHARLGCPGDS